MRTKLSVYNTIAAVLLQVVTMAVNLVLPQVMVRVYGSSVNGLVTSIRQFITYLGFIEAGLAGAAIYALYKPLADKDNGRISGVISAANRFYNIAGFVFSAMIVITTFIYPMFTSGQGISGLKIAALIIIIGASGSLEFFAVGKYKVLFTADQKSYVISCINSGAIAINALIIIFMAGRHYDIVTVQAFALISFVVRSLLYAAYGRIKYSHLNFKAPPINEALDKRWDSLIIQILGVITTATPIVATSLLCGFKEASVFSIYNMVFASVLALLTTFNNGLSAIFGDILAKQETEILQRAYKQYEYLYYGLLTWGFGCAAILIMPFIEVYTRRFTDAVYIRPSVAALFILLGILYNIKTPQGMLLISAGLYKETRIQALIQTLINVIVSFGLAPFLGITGVVIGSILSNLYRDIDLIFFIPKTVTKMKPKATIIRVARLAVLFSISVFPVLLFIDLKPKNLLMWFIYSIPVSIWTLVVVAGGNIIMERKTASEVFSRVRTLIGDFRSP